MNIDNVLNTPPNGDNFLIRMLIFFKGVPNRGVSLYYIASQELIGGDNW